MYETTVAAMGMKVNESQLGGVSSFVKLWKVNVLASLVAVVTTQLLFQHEHTNGETVGE